MRSIRDGSGQKCFKPDEYLNKTQIKGMLGRYSKMNKSGNLENILERLNQDLSASNENSDDVETFNLYEEVSI